jgi:hypothetical protein
MADEKARLPVFIDKFGLQKPFDAKLCKGAPDVVRDILNKAFGKSKSFEVVNSQPKEKGFDVAGTVQNLEYDEKKKTLKGKLSIVLAETPGRSFFGNVSNNATIDGVNPKKLEKSVEELVEALADAGAGDAVKQCEKRMAKMEPVGGKEEKKPEKPQVQVEKVTLGKVWDAELTKDVPDLVGTALVKGLGSKVEVAGSKPKDGFVLQPRVDLDYDQDKGEIFGLISVVVMTGGKSILGTETRKGPIKGVDAKTLPAKLKALAMALGAQVGGDCAATVLKEAGGK